MTFTRVLASCAIAALVLASAPAARANVCGPSPQCNPDDPTTGACCNPSTCTWAATNDPCIDPTGVCTMRKCASDHTCTAGTQRQADSGTPCYPSANQCLVGECDGSGHCLSADDNRCADLNSCTKNICNTDGSGKFTGCDFSQLESDGTNCSDTTNGVCTIRACQSGVCVATQDPPITVTCTQPSISTCTFATCVIQNGSPTCVTQQSPQGSSCDLNPLDCKWQTCKRDGTCGNQAAPNAAACDTNTADDPSHCELGQCDPHKNCLAGTTYHVASGVTQLTFNSPAGPVVVPTCASDNNACTSDECNGAGSCQNRCMAGASCGTPDCPLCCHQNGSSCSCGSCP